MNYLEVLVTALLLVIMAEGDNTTPTPRPTNWTLQSGDAL